MSRPSSYNAKAKFSKVVEKAQGGISADITRRGHTVAGIVPTTSLEWNRSDVLDRAEKLRKFLKGSKHVNLAALLREGRL